MTEDTPTASGIDTLADLPFYVAGRYPKPALVRQCLPEGFEEQSSRDFFERIRDVSLGLSGLGVRRGDRVALICETRPEWLVADLAILTAGAVTVPIYPTLAASLVGYVLGDAAVQTVVASDREQLAKVAEAADSLPELRQVVLIDDADARDDRFGDEVLQLGLDEVGRRGHQRLMHENGLAREYQLAADAVEPGDLATIIYTSGTTGNPKGVMLSHGAIVANVTDADRLVETGDQDEALSFLPLCHALERMVVYLYLFKGVTVTFAESLETVARDLTRVRPTVMTGVPRVFEKLHARVLETVAHAPKPRQLIFRWAIGVGMSRSRAELAGQTPSLLVRLQNAVADRLVFAKIRERVGGRLRFVVSGGAPLPTSVAEFLFAVGVPVLEGYGLTETAPVLTVNPEGAPRIGTVGQALPRVELKIAEDGEILARGPNLMEGYHGRPDATAEAIVDGWFHTGDIGRLDDDGYLSITDRKKEILVTAGGKNVAPQPIEQALKRHPLIAEAMLVGDGRPFVSALIGPDFAALSAQVGGDGEADREALVGRDDVRALYDAAVAEVNATRSRFEQLKTFRLLPVELSQESGELTPTLKVKRRVVMERWQGLIDEMYA